MSGSFKRLRRSMIEAGMPLGDIRRLIAELEDHRADIEADLVAGGARRADAANEARRRLGSHDRILAAVAEQPSLATPTQRLCPRLAIYRSRLIYALVPALAGDTDPRSPLFKWSAAASLSAVATFSLLVLLHTIVTVA